LKAGDDAYGDADDDNDGDDEYFHKASASEALSLVVNGPMKKINSALLYQVNLKLTADDTELVAGWISLIIAGQVNR
jgi:hypothetical protein